jgi:DNA-binding transcriptional ArsR family regulator
MNIGMTPAAPDLIFKTLGDPTRRTIFERLCRDGELTVWKIKEPMGISQPAVSKHLGSLKQAGLVKDRRDGRQTHYSAQPQALASLTDWAARMTGFWESKFDDLENLLKRMDQ